MITTGTAATLRKVVEQALKRIPATAPYADIMIEVLGSVWSDMDGDPEEFREILAANQKDIDRLGRPDDFFGGPAKQPPVKPSGKYGSVVDQHPKAADYQAGDVCWQYDSDPRWVVYQKGVGVGQPQAPWHEVEFAS